MLALGGEPCSGGISDELRGRRADEKTERRTGVLGLDSTASMPGASREDTCGGGGGGDEGSMGAARVARRERMLSSKGCDCCMLCEVLDWEQAPVSANSRLVRANLTRTTWVVEMCRPGYRACAADSHDHRQDPGLMFCFSELELKARFDSRQNC